MKMYVSILLKILMIVYRIQKVECARDSTAKEIDKLPSFSFSIFADLYNQKIAMDLKIQEEIAKFKEERNIKHFDSYLLDILEEELFENHLQCFNNFPEKQPCQLPLAFREFTQAIIGHKIKLVRIEILKSQASNKDENKFKEYEKKEQILLELQDMFMSSLALISSMSTNLHKISETLRKSDYKRKSSGLLFEKYKEKIVNLWGYFFFQAMYDLNEVVYGNFKTKEAYDKFSRLTIGFNNNLQFQCESLVKILDECHTVASFRKPLRTLLKL